jgi:conjugative relaxase-like TrwC/TraI family protein
MISMHNIANAGQALQYFSKDNYYTQAQGLSESEWVGKGAALLGLKGQIDKAEFFEALEGKFEGQALGKWIRNPKTGEPEREHRPGLDMTFSAPKSVSLLAEIQGSNEVRLAHEEAVKAALSYIEKEFSIIRQNKDNTTKLVNTGNLVIATFKHNTSRDLDPQTHTHAIIMNATRREDGQWRSLTNDEIYKNQRLIGAIYTSALADRLQKLGYELTRCDQYGNFEIAGISREQIEHFSQRRTQIETFLAAKGILIQEASALQKEQATLKTRAHKTQVDHDTLMTEWENRAQAIGLNFEKIEKGLGTEGKASFNKISGQQAMEFAVKHVLEREAVVAKQTLLSVALEHSVSRVSPEEVVHAFEQMEKEGELIRLSQDGYTSKKMQDSERWALAYIQQQKNQTTPLMDQETIAVRIEWAEKQQGFQYSDGQKEALTLALTSKDRTIAIQGLAGTGKTTMLKALREMAQEQDYTVRGMAPTGAASKILAKETGIIADTVSMFQIKERQLQKDIAFTQQYATNFTRKPEIWVVDESSFLSQRQKVQLDHMAEKAQAKLIYLGDALQLQGVQAGKPFELAQKNGLETAYMTDINRQKTVPLQTAVNMILGKDPLAPQQRLTQVEALHNAKAFGYMDQAGMVREVKDNTIGELVQDFFKLDGGARRKTLIITAYNQDRRTINEAIRQEMLKAGEITESGTHQILVSQGWTKAMLKEAQYYQQGHIVRFGRDYQTMEVQKGEYLRVVGQDKNAVILQKENGERMTWSPHKYNKVEVYREESRELGVGDVIRFTRNSEQIKNGEVAKVVGREGGQYLLEAQQEKEKTSLKVDLSKNRHWEYGYAVTVHAAQGTTQYRTFFHIQIPEGEKKEENDKLVLAQMAKVFGQRSFYVGSTRASHELTIYTNDKNKAAQAIGAKQDKSSVLETMNKGQDISQRGLPKSR